MPTVPVLSVPTMLLCLFPTCPPDSRPPPHAAHSDNPAHMPFSILVLFGPSYLAPAICSSSPKYQLSPKAVVPNPRLRFGMCQSFQTLPTCSLPSLMTPLQPTSMYFKSSHPRDLPMRLGCKSDFPWVSLHLRSFLSRPFS